MKRFYKVVKREKDGTLVSAITEIFKTIYIPNKWTYPQIGKLFVFGDFSSAESIFLWSWNLEVWECEVGESNYPVYKILKKC